MAKHHTNGINGKDHPYGLRRRLQRLLDHHQGIADSIRTTLAALDADAVATKRQRGADVVQSAVQLDATRADATRTKKPTKQGYSTKEAIRARRERSIKFLANFDRTEPRPMPQGATAQNSGLGPLIHGGYLRKKGDGFIRTAKEYQP